MKEVIKTAEGTLPSMINKLIDNNANSTWTVIKPSSQTNDEECGDMEKGQSNPKREMKCPKLEPEIFKCTCPEITLMDDFKEFLAFVAMVILLIIVFCKGFNVLTWDRYPSGFLFFFFGVITLMLVGLIMLAYFMMKASAKRSLEKNERENKNMAFRQKMIETAFEIENMELFAEKQSIEKMFSMKEKANLYFLDEKQRIEEHWRKMQLRKYEIVENYMKHVVDLAKTKEETNKGDNDSTEK